MSEYPRTLHVMSTGPGFGNWIAAEGVRRYLPAGIPSIDFRRVDPAGIDVLIIGGGGFLHSGAESFWRRVAEARCRVILWGLGACQPLPGTPDRGRIRPLDPSVMARIRPRIALAAVRDEWTRDLYSLDAEILFCPSIKALEGVPVRPSTRSLYAHHPGLVGKTEAQRLAGLCDQTTDHVRSPGAATPQAVVALHASVGFCVTSRLHGAVVSKALGVPYVALARDRKIVEFVRRWGGGLLMHGEIARVLAPGAGAIPSAPPIDILGNDRFAAEVRRLVEAI
ncbi:MAG: hypothetical protein GC159_11575 [Phycisphaera sp.]|nr:hypothetical protein [Phycisphaera sp.]